MTFFAVLFADYVLDEYGEEDIEIGILGIFDNREEARALMNEEYTKHAVVTIESW